MSNEEQCKYCEKLTGCEKCDLSLLRDAAYYQQLWAKTYMFDDEEFPPYNAAIFGDTNG